MPYTMQETDGHYTGGVLDTIQGGWTLRGGGHFTLILFTSGTKKETSLFQSFQALWVNFTICDSDQTS